MCWGWRGAEIQVEGFARGTSGVGGLNHADLHFLPSDQESLTPGPQRGLSGAGAQWQQARRGQRGTRPPCLRPLPSARITTSGVPIGAPVPGANEAGDRSLSRR